MEYILARTRKKTSENFRNKFLCPNIKIRKKKKNRRTTCKNFFNLNRYPSEFPSSFYSSILEFDQEFRCSPLPFFLPPPHIRSHIITPTKKSVREEDVGISPGYGFSSAHPHSPPSGETERRWHNSIRKFKAFPSFLGGGEGSVSMHKLKPIRLSLIYSWPSLVDRIYTRNIPFRSPFG